MIWIQYPQWVRGFLFQILGDKQQESVFQMNKMKVIDIECFDWSQAGTKEVSSSGPSCTEYSQQSTQGDLQVTRGWGRKMSCDVLVLHDLDSVPPEWKLDPMSRSWGSGARAVPPMLHALTQPPQSSLDRLEGAALYLVWMGTHSPALAAVSAGWRYQEGPGPSDPACHGGKWSLTGTSS